ncbi:MAG: LuxR C-terminal-related transcriptional regulator [Cyanobacteria bacterium P01_F01_bin.150]
MSSTSSNAPDDLAKQALSLSNESMSSPVEQSIWLRIVLESLMDGVLVVNCQGKVVQYNSRGRQICKQLRRYASDAYCKSGLDWEQRMEEARDNNHNHQKMDVSNLETFAEWKMLPAPIWIVCQTMLDSQEDCSELTLVPEQQIILPLAHQEGGLTLRIRAQWLMLPSEMSGDRHCDTALQSMEPLKRRSYILITMEDCDQSIQHLARADKKRYRLTARETEIWHMRLRGQSYRDIADHLVISPNTVKKHLKNILAKRREVLEDAG